MCICAGGLRPPQPEPWTAAGQVRQPWLAVVAIETRICVHVCVQDPDMPYRLGQPSLRGADQT